MKDIRPINASQSLLTVLEFKFTWTKLGSSLAIKINFIINWNNYSWIKVVKNRSFLLILKIITDLFNKKIILIKDFLEWRREAKQKIF